MIDLQRPVVTIIVERNGGNCTEILLQRRRKPGDEFDGVLELPQGKVEHHESIFCAAARELREESGLHLESLKDALGNDLRECPDLHGFVALLCVVDVQHNYLALVLLGTADGIAQDTSEAIEHRWVGRSELADVLKSERIFPLNVPMIEAYIQRAAQ
jgi:8-oxo-dGTP pyrophosphatase MutT (NUDIX family)